MSEKAKVVETPDEDPRKTSMEMLSVVLRDGERDIINKGTTQIDGKIIITDIQEGMAHGLDEIEIEKFEK